jgi:hypothetical protein
MPHPRTQPPVTHQLMTRAFIAIPKYRSKVPQNGTRLRVLDFAMRRKARWTCQKGARSFRVSRLARREITFDQLTSFVLQLRAADSSTALINRDINAIK